MTSIVERLQSDALRQDVSVSSLLRQVKLIAAKLRLAVVADWVEYELNGYGRNEIPSYRIVKGMPRAHNPYNGWIPIVLDDPKMTEVISKRAIGQKLPELEDLVSTPSATTLTIPFPADLVAKLNRSTDIPFHNMALLVSRSAVVGIIDAVRNKILDWAIELDNAGIKGSDVTFSPDEQTRAQQKNVTLHIGSIGHFVGNLGAGNKSGDIVSGAIDAQRVKKLVEQVTQHEQQLVLEGVAATDLRGLISRLQQELSQPIPKQAKLTSLLQDLRAIITNTTGNLLSSGLLQVINQILGVSTH